MPRYIGAVITSDGRSVAQPGSALYWGCRGREFKSRRSDQKLNNKINILPTLGLNWPGGFFAFGEDYGEDFVALLDSFDLFTALRSSLDWA